MSDPVESASNETAWREIRYEYTPLLPEILSHLRATIVVTTYQAGKLLVLGVHHGTLKISLLNFDQPMGVAVGTDRLAIGSRRQIHFFRASHQTAPYIEPHGVYDGCFVPRTSFYTGAIHGHDLAFGREGLWVVNTLFSCLCTLHDAYSFVPRWRPWFVSKLIDEDRCHLNGLAMQNGEPRYVTAMAKSDEAGGWRPHKASTGCFLDVQHNVEVVGGLCMPHSPRLLRDELWVLNSGHGTLGRVDLRSGRYDAVESMPGYTRGLAFAGQFAFVGLSKIRETSVFGGVPIAEDRANLRCGVGVVDLVSGHTVAVFQFLTGVEEIFAVDVISGVSCPLIAGASVDQQERDVWIVPESESG